MRAAVCCPIAVVPQVELKAIGELANESWEWNTKV